MKSITLKIITLAITALFGVIALNTAPVFADDICSNPNISSEIKASSGCGSSSGQLPSVIQGILNVIISIAGIIAVVFIVVGGFQYMTSSGDAGKVKRAKDTILYACIGLVVCVLAFAIVNFTIGTILKQ